MRLSTKRISLLAAIVALLPVAARADQLTFGAGSLIIPVQSNFQAPCGVAAAYGLVWRLLESNQAGHFNANHPVTVYWVINSTKNSPNRCVPTNLQSPPSPNAAGPSGATNHWDDPQWNDGCDLTIHNATTQPVVPVDFSKDPWTGASPTGMFAINPVPMRSVGTSEAIPNFAAVALNNTSTPRFTDIQYQGGPFVIDSSDAQNVIEFLEQGDSYTNTSLSGALKQFTGTNAPYSATSTSWFNSCSSVSQSQTAGTTTKGGPHYVWMHQATASFTANVSKRINQDPPPIAVLDSSNGGGTLSSGILDNYLQNAGLYVSGTSGHYDSAGCPSGSFSSCNLNGSTSGTKNPGTIYDVFSADDDLISTASYPYGLLNAKNASGKLAHRVFWTPHWEISNSYSNTHYAANGDGASNQSQNAVNNIAHFAAQKGTGLMAECASLGSYEDAYDTSGSNQDPNISSNTRFLFTNGIMINGLSDQTWAGKNCTDPDYVPTNGDECMLYPNAGNPFSQIGDFPILGTGGHVHNYKPTNESISGTPTTSAYRTGVLRLTTSWTQYHSGDFPTGGSGCDPTSKSCDKGWDFFDLGNYNNDPTLAQVVYVGGHTFDSSVAGTRMILNTLLNLGQDPVSSDRALSAPVAYNDPNGYQNNGTALPEVFSSTYTVVSPAPSNPSVTTFTPGISAAGATYTINTGSAAVWQFPLHKGNLYVHPLTAAGSISALGGSSSYNSGTIWDADSAMPSPGARNLFTYFGGQVQSNATGGAQNNWVPDSIDGHELVNGPGSGPTQCVDVMQLGALTDKHGTSFGLIPGADGECDLAESAELVSLVPGTDFGAAEWAATLGNKALIDINLPNYEWMFQMVRGYCFAASSGLPNLSPAPADCFLANSLNPPDDKAHVGGLVHAAPAVVPFSANIADSGAHRPTVAYAAGLDGELHAFYVSGGHGYKGPQATLHFPNPGASSKFATHWLAESSPAGLGTDTSMPTYGEELWAYMPASQLPLLAGNKQAVDSAPVVQDVFVDLTGSGKREWHTVLVGAAGDPLGTPGSEIFALDVTNPLKPVLLWDLVGYWNNSAVNTQFAPVLQANNVSVGTDFSSKYTQRTYSGGSPAYPAVGSVASGTFDYSDLGGSYGLSMGLTRKGLEPAYAVFVASNASGDTAPISNGLEIFAIDVANGQKLWQWQEPYNPSPTNPQVAASNVVPMPAALLGGTAGVSALYAGDAEGNLWELGANTGRTLDPNHSVPIFTTGTTAQPISTTIGLALLPASIPAANTFHAWQNQYVAIFGTAGVNASGISTDGQVHVVNIDAQSRTGSGTVPAELAPFPLTETGRRLYGQITISGQTAFFETASAPVHDAFSIANTTTGATFELDLGADLTTGATQLANFNSANFGGVTVYHDQTSSNSYTDHIIGNEFTTLKQTTLSSASSGAGVTSPGENGTKGVSGPKNGIVYRLIMYLERFL